MKRREALKTLAAAAALPQAKRTPPPAVPVDTWKPRVLDAHQDRTVTMLAELIIPRTETPGATDAQVNRYIDTMLAGYPVSRREEFLRGLAWLDGHCLNLHAAPFADLKPEEQVEILRKLSTPGAASDFAPGVRFFRSIKGMASNGYYTSKVGLEEELGWGKNPAEEPPGCDHPEHGKR